VLGLGIDSNCTADKVHTNDAKFRKFRRQLFHSSLAKILETLKPGMTTPEILPCFDGHFRRIIYSLGPYIADYPEQALLACIVQGWCARYVVMALSSRYCKADSFCSCTAKDLTVAGGRRSREHTEALVSEFELGILWDEYGLVGDLVVCNRFIGPFIPP
jgi:Plavaka transposase